MIDIEQIEEARRRLASARRELDTFHYDVFTENEVRFRIETISDMILIVESDLRTMKKEWNKEN